MSTNFMQYVIDFQLPETRNEFDAGFNCAIRLMQSVAKEMQENLSPPFYLSYDGKKMTIKTWEREPGRFVPQICYDDGCSITFSNRFPTSLEAVLFAVSVILKEN